MATEAKLKGLSGLCAGKNNVLHVPASQLLGTLLAKNPADRIAYVAFRFRLGPTIPVIPL